MWQRNEMANALDSENETQCKRLSERVCSAWIGSWDNREMYAFSAYDIEDGWGADGIPRCRMLQRVNVGMNPYGAAVDSRGFAM